MVGQGRRNSTAGHVAADALLDAHEAPVNERQGQFLFMVRVQHRVADPACVLGNGQQTGPELMLAQAAEGNDLRLRIVAEKTIRRWVPPEFPCVPVLLLVLLVGVPGCAEGRVGACSLKGVRATRGHSLGDHPGGLQWQGDGGARTSKGCRKRHCTGQGP